MTDDRTRTPLRVMSALAVELAFNRSLVPDFTARTGRRTDFVWEPTTVLMRRIAGGERADVIVAIDAAMDELEAGGILDPATRRPLASAVLGLAVAPGAAHPDISTSDSFREALLAAPSIAVSDGGASGIAFRQLVASLGIADEIAAKSVTIPSGFTAAKIVSGEAQMAVQQLSELMSVEGVEIVGPFPDGVQTVTPFSAAAFAGRAETAADFLRHISSETACRAYAAGGLVSRIDA